jgi:malate dehydrogenase (oxaloacetate-decarboxylating)
VEIVPKCRVRDFKDFAVWYTPGVAAPCMDIERHPEKVFEHTNKSNFVAIVSDGTRVLGLGDIGPEAALPVMEGKALLFKHLGGVDAFPICLQTKNPDEIIQACKWLAPTFGGINLEDIEKPKCFYILKKLREESNIPIWHDDQQGTGAVTLAALINALKIADKSKEHVRIAMIGAGAANVALFHIMIAYGFPPGNVVMVDSNGILHKERDDLKLPGNEEKVQICKMTNRDGRTGGIREALIDTDCCIAFSTQGPGIIKPQWVSLMAKRSIVFACANPVPEIWPWEAKEAGAQVVATGRSDFPNQVNNSLGFPGIFRGVLDVGASKITDEMCIAAAEELVAYAEEKELSEEYIIPRMVEGDIFPREAAAVAMKAIEQGVARISMTRDEAYQKASRIINRARKETRVLMEQGIIAAPPDESRD